MTSREKIALFLQGNDVGPVVSPLCDDWATDRPYQWALTDRAEPYPVGSPHHSLSQQMSMAAIFHWDPLFLAKVDLLPKNKELIPKVTRIRNGDITQIITKITTPYGDLKRVEEEGNTYRLLEDFLKKEEDYNKMIWFMENTLQLDENPAMEEAKQLREVVGDLGMIGTWYGASIYEILDPQEMFYHIADYPEKVQEIYELQCQLNRNKMRIYQNAGFDYMFYSLVGTEWSSPEFFKQWVMPEITANIEHYRANGGFTVWHTCGQAKYYIESGIINTVHPEIFETISEPPVGNVPSLGWARKQIDRSIATKGNVPLDMMLCSTPKQIREKVAQIRSETKGYRHIFGLGDDLMAQTPYENIVAYVEEARKEV